MDQIVHDNSLLHGADAFMRSNRPMLAEILGAVCELYRVDPDEIEQRAGIQARRAYCFFAERWSREPCAAIGAMVGMTHREVARVAERVAYLSPEDHLLRDDMDLLTVSIAERVLRRKRGGGHR
ncbi:MULTISPECIES: hypothetical protein [unclassified Bradyrhizobium]|uniref:hypothetical protein n=1 Tax=unclassified Bradyrhizobium TaxID=2631580 RepID=UPI002FF02CA9